MSRLLEIQEQLAQTGQTLATMTREAAKHPARASMAANLRSLEKRQKYLEVDFLKATKASGLDVCCYRSFRAAGNIKAAPAFESIVEFQKVFSVTYDAHKHGPKQRGVVDQNVFADTAFGFGYAFTGSLGVVLTLPNDRLLFGETNLDATIEDVFALAKADTSKSIRKFKERLGIPPINAIYRWANVQARSSIGADVDWRRGENVRAKLFVQHQELDHLRQLIEETSEETATEMQIEGTIESVIHHRQSFTLSTSAGSITGTYTDAIGPEHKVEVPGKTYRARLRKTTKTVYSTGEVTDSYFLIKLTVT